jgi:hypothetical protein
MRGHRPLNFDREMSIVGCPVYWDRFVVIIRQHPLSVQTIPKKGNTKHLK